MISAVIERLLAESEPGETRTQRLPIRVLIRYNEAKEPVFVGLADDLEHALARVRALHGVALTDSREDDDHALINTGPTWGGPTYVALAQYAAVTRPLK